MFALFYDYDTFTYLVLYIRHSHQRTKPTAAGKPEFDMPSVFIRRIRHAQILPATSMQDHNIATSDYDTDKICTGSMVYVLCVPLTLSYPQDSTSRALLYCCAGILEVHI